MRLLEATTDFLGEYDALSRMPLGMEGFVQWFVLEESPRPLGRFLQWGGAPIALAGA